MAHTAAREFVSHVLDLAVNDSARAWLTLMLDLGASEAPDVPTGELAVACHHGQGHVDEGRMTGRWPGVVGARYADWLILPVRDTSAHRVVVSRDDATIEVSEGYDGLRGAGIADVTVSDLAVDRAHLAASSGAPVLACAGAAAVVVGSALGLWRRHVEHLRAQLASSSEAVTDTVAAQVASAASDIDAAQLQITEMPAPDGDVVVALATCRQAVARARAAADRLLEHSRHALDASHPVTLRWREVDAGSRMAVRMLDGLSAQLG